MFGRAAICHDPQPREPFVRLAPAGELGQGARAAIKPEPIHRLNALTRKEWPPLHELTTALAATPLSARHQKSG